MTIKQYYKLKKHEDILFTARYCDYFRNLTQSKRVELEEMYEELFKEKSSLNAGCGGCQLKSLKRLAVPYFQMKEKMEKRKEEEIVEEEPQEEQNDITDNEIEDEQNE